MVECNVHCLQDIDSFVFPRSCRMDAMQSDVIACSWMWTSDPWHTRTRNFIIDQFVGLDRSRRRLRRLSLSSPLPSCTYEAAGVRWAYAAQPDAATMRAAWDNAYWLPAPTRPSPGHGAYSGGQQSKGHLSIRSGNTEPRFRRFTVATAACDPDQMTDSCRRDPHQVVHPFDEIGPRAPAAETPRRRVQLLSCRRLQRGICICIALFTMNACAHRQTFKNKNVIGLRYRRKSLSTRKHFRWVGVQHKALANCWSCTGRMNFHEPLITVISLTYAVIQLNYSMSSLNSFVSCQLVCLVSCQPQLFSECWKVQGVMGDSRRRTIVKLCILFSLRHCSTFSVAFPFTVSMFAQRWTWCFFHYWT